MINNQNLYAQVIPHQVYDENHGKEISFDDIDEQDIIRIGEQIKQGAFDHAHFGDEDDDSYENLELTDDILVDPDLVTYNESDETGSNQSTDDDQLFKISPNSTTQYTIQSGDSLSKILDFLGFSANEVNNFISDKQIKTKLKQIKPGQHVEIKTDSENKITEVRYFYDLLETYEAKLVDGKWQGSTITNEHTVQTLKIAANIDSTLSEAAKANGISKSVINKLSSIFKEKINLNKDIQKGDSFAVIYEHLYINGKPYKPSNLLAAELNVDGKRYTAIRHADEDSNYANYYDINGKPLVTKETFRRHPVENVRITSKFGPRIHPILKRKKMHYGVDYGAKRGTPIYAIADGKVEHAGRKGSYGTTIITKHSSGYKSLFAHMNKLAKGIKKGTFVKKGQIIGYVGSTGRSTGPHLHYELFKGNKRINPLTADLPREISIPSDQRNEFLANARQWEKELQSLRNERLVNAASNDATESR